jgi:hypothetical protein
MIAGYPASVRLAGSEIGSLHNKHGHAGGEQCHCFNGDRPANPLSGSLLNPEIFSL